MNDEQLIQDYRLHHRQEAFAELVRRHAGLVYGTACRHVGDPFAAQEICQEAFCALARQLASIRNPHQLPAWLYQTTRRLAAMHVRGDQRRVARERMAAVMNSEDTDAAPSWERVEPLLDEALGNLGEQDRAAILGRFFRGMSMAEVAEGLGVSEAAAKMRVGRAVEKLRTFFSQHGAACSAAALVLLLERNAAAQPPAPVMASVLNQVAKLRIGPQGTSANSGGWPHPWVAVPAAIVLVLLGLTWSAHQRAFAVRHVAGTSPTVAAGTTQVLSAVSPRQRAVKTAPAEDSLRLTVLDANSLAPISGVQATASAIRLVGEPLGEAVTDVDGRCVLPRPPAAPGDFFFSVRAQKDGYASMALSWSRFQKDEPGDIPDAYELRMSPGTRIGGIVTDDQGHPAKGVQVKLQGAVFRSGPPPRQRARLNDGASETTLTDAEGRWSWDRMPPEWEDTRLVFAGREFPPTTYVCDANLHPFNGQIPLAKEELLAGRARVELKHGLVIAGKVLDPGGQPLGGVRIVQDSNWHDDYAWTMTGNDGAYRILNASTGALTLSFQAEHYSPQTAEVVVEGSTTFAPVTLAPGHLLRGRVVDDAGNPVEGAAISAALAGGRQGGFQWRTHSDAAGAFSWDGAPDGSLSLFLANPGFQRATTTLAANAKEHVITLQRPTEQAIRVQGEVYDDDTGAPIPVFEVLVSQGVGRERAAKEGRDGRFTLSLDRSFNSSGASMIAIHAGGYEPAEGRSVPATNVDDPLTFRLRRSKGWNGVVLLPNGEPAFKAEVALSSLLCSPILGRRQLLYRDQCVFRLTGEDGRFHFDSLESVPSRREASAAAIGYGHHLAKLIVAVHPQGYAEMDVAQLDRQPTLKLQPWGRIEGLLHFSGRSVARQQINASKRFCLPWVPSILLSPMVFTTSTDADGRFAMEDVPPGEHALGCCFPRCNDEIRCTAHVNPGETSRADLGGNGSTLAGRVSVPKYQSGFDFSQSQGDLRRVLAKPADLPSAVRRTDFASDKAYDQASEVDGAKRIAWWRSPEGLAAWRESRSYAVWFDADGAFHAEDVPAGDYTFHVLLHEPAEHSDGERPIHPPRLLGIYQARVVVPESGNAKPGEPVDLGIVELAE